MTLTKTGAHAVPELCIEGALGSGPLPLARGLTDSTNSPITGVLSQLNTCHNKASEGYIHLPKRGGEWQSQDSNPTRLTPRPGMQPQGLPPLPLWDPAGRLLCPSFHYMGMALPASMLAVESRVWAGLEGGKSSPQELGGP